MSWQEREAEGLFIGLTMATIINWVVTLFALIAQRYDIAGFGVSAGLACALIAVLVWKRP